MATFRPFAYNPTASPITGTSQTGDLAIGTASQDYYSPGPSPGPGGVKWFGGPDEDIGYVIATPFPAGNMPTPDGLNNGTIRFYRTPSKTDQNFVNLTSYVSSKEGGTGPFASVTEAINWLDDNGIWYSYTPGPVTSGLILSLDAGNYPGSGTSWIDTSGNGNTATLINTPTYSSSNGGYLQFDDASLEYATVPNLGNITNWTVECWFRLTTALTSKVTAIVCNQYDLSTKLNFSIGTNNAPTNRNIAAGFYNGAWRTTTGFVPLLNTWYQVVGTYDGSTIRQYVNGVPNGGTLSYVGIPQSGGEIRIMRRWDDSLTSGNFVDGDLGIVRIYNTALSAADVSNNFESARNRYGL